MLAYLYVTYTGKILAKLDFYRLFHELETLVITREGFLRKNIVAVSFFSKLCYTPIFLIHVHIFSIK